MRRIFEYGGRAMAIAILLLCAGCVSDPAAGDAMKLEKTQSAYHSALRWGTLEQALAMHDPELIKSRPVTTFELERWRQFRVVGYRDSPSVATATGRVQQRVALELINLNTQGVRNVLDVQEWRYDVAAKRWWLTSGLPSLDAR